jgi:Alpha/beta hydrolase of unknown function (DUF1400)
MSRQINQLLLGVSSSVVFASVGSMLSAAPSHAAEMVSLWYGGFQRSVPVADLRAYADTGTVPPNSQLASLFTIVPKKEQAELLTGLKFKVPLNVVAVDKLVRSPIGEQIIGKVAAIVRRPGGSVNVAIRGGLVTAAASKDGLGVMSFLEAYPNTLIIDMRKALKDGKDISGLFQGFIQQMGS